MADVTKTIRMLIVGDATGATKSFQSVSRSMLSSIRGADTLGKKARVAGLALGGIGAAALVAGAAVAVKFGKDSVEAFKKVGGETLKLSRITGMTAEDSSRLGFAFKMTGIDAETGARSMGLFEKNVTKMAAADTAAKIKAAEHAETLKGQIAALEKAGPSSANYSSRMATLKAKLADATAASHLNASALGDLGVKYTDAHGKMLPMSELLPAVADKFKEMPDGAEKSALAMKLFGKSGVQMLPFLNKGSEGLRELGIQSDKTGNTLSGKNLDALKKNKEEQRKFDAAMQGLSVTVGSMLLPVLTQGAEMLNSVLVPALMGATQFVKDNQSAFDGLGNMMRWFWNTILLPVVKLWIAGNASIAQGIGIVLEATGRLTGNKDLENFGKGVQNAAQGVKDWAASLKEIPPKVAPKIAVNDKATKEVERIDAKIKSVKDRIVTAKAKGDDKGVRDLEAKLNALQSKRWHATITVGVTMNKGADEVTYKVGGKGTMKFSARARGGWAPPGWVLRGENGPELTYESRPTYTYTAQQTRSMMSVGAGVGGGGSVVNHYYQIDASGLLTDGQAGTRIESILDRYNRSHGGSGWKAVTPK